MPRVTNRLLKVKDVCHSLSISDDSFSRHWEAVFTETRDAEDRRSGVHRKVFEGELAAAVDAGGGKRGIAAVLLLRSRMKRL